jgi:hypothetical protein
MLLIYKTSISSLLCMEEGWGILIFAFKRGIKAPLYNAKNPADLQKICRKAEKRCAA